MRKLLFVYLVSYTSVVFVISEYKNIPTSCLCPDKLLAFLFCYAQSLSRFILVGSLLTCRSVIWSIILSIIFFILLSICWIMATVPILFCVCCVVLGWAHFYISSSYINVRCSTVCFQLPCWTFNGFLTQVLIYYDWLSFLSGMILVRSVYLPSVCLIFLASSVAGWVLLCTVNTVFCARRFFAAVWDGFHYTWHVSMSRNVSETSFRMKHCEFLVCLKHWQHLHCTTSFFLYGALYVTLILSVYRIFIKSLSYGFGSRCTANNGSGLWLICNMFVTFVQHGHIPQFHLVSCTRFLSGVFLTGKYTFSYLSWYV